jgi:hypothetical protein
MVHQTSFKLICPAGLVIDRINLEADLMLICARSSATGSSMTCFLALQTAKKCFGKQAIKFSALVLPT